MSLFHLSSWFTSKLLSSEDTSTARFKTSSSPSAPTEPTSMLSAAGEMSVSSRHPAVQLKANYGLTKKLFTASLFGGTATAENGMFVANSGTDANGVAAVLSNKEITVRAGQGIKCLLSNVFDTPQLNNIQIGGLITSESALCFGYDEDMDFGILYARGGALEIQDLDITSGATSNENATITIDNVGHTVALSNGGDAKLNAYEIATYLQINEQRYNFTANGSIVTCVAKLPELGGGIFTFSSGTATATFAEIKVSDLGTNTWIKKADWNVNNSIDINPQLGNAYLIQYAFNGFEGINFFIKNPETNMPELVHVIKYGNTDVIPSVENPIFRVGWGSRNVGNTTPVSVKGAAGAAFNEGDVVFDYDTQGIDSSTTITSNNDDYNLSTIRSRRVFNSSINRAETMVVSVIVSSELARAATFKVFKNATVGSGDYFDYVYTDEAGSLVEHADNPVIVTGGELLGSVTLETGIPWDLKGLFNSIAAGDTLTFTASKPAGSTGDAYISINLQDDL